MRGNPRAPTGASWSGLGLAAVTLWVWVAACGGREAAAAALERKLSASAEVTVKVTYEAVATDEDGDLQVVARVIQRPPDRRVDFLEDGELLRSVLSLDGQLISCSPAGCNPVSEKDPGYFEAKDRLGATDMLDLRDELQKEGTDRYDVNTLSDRVIASVTAECFKMTPQEPTSAQDPSFEWCFSPDGILLFVGTDFGGHGVFSIEAKEVDYGVTDEDFALPFAKPS